MRDGPRGVPIAVLHALILGIVQGLTEYLPISSSGHLILLPYLLGWPEHSQTFDVALHLGTALSLLWFFRADWVSLTRAFFTGLVQAQVRATDPAWRLALYVVVGSVPAGLVGALLEDTFERVFRAPILVGAFMIGFGLLLFAADHFGRHRREVGQVGWVDAVVVGISQAVALMPGVSRSGITITMGLFRGLTREAAARFSFLLSGPIIVAAALYKLRHGIPTDDTTAFLVGTAASAVVGWLAIGALLRYLQHRSVAIFVVARVIVGTTAIVAGLTRGG